MGRLLCVAGTVLGGLGLLGWIVGSSRLTSVLPGQPPMMPNTAVALMLLGLAGVLRHREHPGRPKMAIAVGAAIVALAIGGGTIIEYALHVDLHIDQLLLHTDGGPHPGRPSPFTAPALLFLAIAVLVLDTLPSAPGRPSEGLAVSAALLAFTSLTGFLFEADELYRMATAPVIGVALPTAVSVLLISVGLLLERPTWGFMRVVTSPCPGGILLRRLALPALLMPVLLALVLLRRSDALDIQLVAPPFAVLTTVMAIGSMVLVTIAAVLLDRSHEALMHDISERERLEQALRHSQAKASAIQARDDVLGIVAHDLRNPLSIVRMQAMLLRDNGSQPADMIKRAADKLDRAVSRMSRLIQDLLDVTAMEANRLSLERARVPPGQVIRDALEAQSVIADSSGLELRAEVPEELPELWADRDRLMQVLENLIGNALKLTESGGHIMVGAAVVTEGEVSFWVTDTGPGIAAEDLPHLFERFWQAPRARRRGTGLGLPIVKGIVEAHGGRVWVESTLGTGSTFFFAIPVASGAGRDEQNGV